jgi:hypothetical protein
MLMLAYSAVLACVFVLSSYVPNTWSQGQLVGGGGAFPATNQLSGSGVAVVGNSSAAASQTHLMSTATLSNGAQQVVLIDPAKFTLAVYHIEPGKGDIQLKSVRKIDADFMLEEFNLSEPTPSTIRKNLRIDSSPNRGR